MLNGLIWLKTDDFLAWEFERCIDAVCECWWVDLLMGVDASICDAD